jgi:ferredoxin
MSLRINVDWDLCASTGNCVLIAPEVFRFEGDDLVFEETPDESHREQVLEAVKGCPMQAISVQD